MDETLRKALEALKLARLEFTLLPSLGIQMHIPEIDAAIAAIEQHKPVVRMLTDEELAECCGRAVPNSAAMTWMRRSIRKFAEKNGLTIGEHG